MGSADLLIDGYTDGVLGRHGFGEDELRAAYPDLIRVRVSCYGHVGRLVAAMKSSDEACCCGGFVLVVTSRAW